MEPFENPFGDTLFIIEMVSNNRLLWKFKDCVAGWMFGVSRFKKFVYLRHREYGSLDFLTRNTNEKVPFIKQHHQEYIVIALEAVDDTGRELNHNHSIVVKVRDQGAQFDLDALMLFQPGTSISELQEPFGRLYLPWSNDSISLVS